ncbi:MAG TPA: hypothetical protein VNR11_17420 [Xanthobacteraceae bacterium]|nr:hypothetical protein [Xanthobacteraceae bacterium]
MHLVYTCPWSGLERRRLTSLTRKFVETTRPPVFSFVCELCEREHRFLLEEAFFEGDDLVAQRMLYHGPGW